MNELLASSGSVGCRRFIVSGRVQGVWFRDSTRRQARQLGLVGYAKNLPDGTVEVLARGASDNIDALERWLHHGPTHADVSDVEEVSAASCAVAKFSGFSVL